MLLVVIKYSHLYLQEREENHCFDAQKLANGFHWFELGPVCPVEQNQAIHGHKLGKVVYRNHVREGNLGAEVTLSINSSQFTYH